MPLSGALEGLKGDIYCPKFLKEFEYAPECKHYKEIKFNNLLTAKSHDMYMFWDQAVREAKEMGDFFECPKKPLLIFRWDRSKDFVAWDDDINITNQIVIRSFGYKFKIGLLSEWLQESNVKLK